MTDLEPRGSPLTDSPSDRALRFGCGALLGIVIVLALGLGGVAQGDLSLLVVLGLVVVVTCGLLGASHGDRFFKAVVSRLDWFV